MIHSFTRAALLANAQPPARCGGEKKASTTMCPPARYPLIIPACERSISFSLSLDTAHTLPSKSALLTTCFPSLPLSPSPSPSSGRCSTKPRQSNAKEEKKKLEEREKQEKQPYILHSLFRARTVVLQLRAYVSKAFERHKIQ